MLDFNQARAQFARSLEDYQKALGNVEVDPFPSAFSLIRDHEALVAETYKLRATRGPADPLRESAEEYLAAAAQVLLVAQARPTATEGPYTRWVREYRRIWRENFGLFAFTAALFLVAGVVGWLIGTSGSDLAGVLLSQPLVERIMGHEAWFESIRHAPLLDGLSIAWNNIHVGFNTFLGGMAFGLGGLALLVYNGLQIGGCLGFCYANNFHAQLGRFILSHGPLELTILVATAFASLHFGRVFYLRPYSLFGERMRRAARESGILISGMLPWLVLAAGLESLVSPWPQYPIWARIMLGLIAALLFWVWTFWPEPSDTK